MRHLKFNDGTSCIKKDTWTFKVIASAANVFPAVMHLSIKLPLTLRDKILLENTRWILQFILDFNISVPYLNVVFFKISIYR